MQNQGPATLGADDATPARFFVLYRHHLVGVLRGCTMGAGLDPSADSFRLDQHFPSEHERATAAGAHSQRDNLVPMTGDARRVLRTIRGGKTSEVRALGSASSVEREVKTRPYTPDPQISAHVHIFPGRRRSEIVFANPISRRVSRSGRFGNP